MKMKRNMKDCKEKENDYTSSADSPISSILNSSFFHLHTHSVSQTQQISTFHIIYIHYIVIEHIHSHIHVHILSLLMYCVYNLVTAHVITKSGVTPLFFPPLPLPLPLPVASISVLY